MQEKTDDNEKKINNHQTKSKNGTKKITATFEVKTVNVIYAPKMF